MIQLKYVYIQHYKHTTWSRAIRIKTVITATMISTASTCLSNTHNGLVLRATFAASKFFATTPFLRRRIYVTKSSIDTF